MPEIYVNLNIPKKEMLKYYQGISQEVRTTSIDGKSISFPANILRKFIQHNGIKGIFKINYNADGKLITIDQVSS